MLDVVLAGCGLLELSSRLDVVGEVAAQSAAALVWPWACARACCARKKGVVVEVARGGC